MEEIPACAEHDRLFWGFLCSSASLDRDSPIIQLQELMRLDFVSDLGPVFSTMAFQHGSLLLLLLSQGYVSSPPLAIWGSFDDGPCLRMGVRFQLFTWYSPCHEIVEFRECVFWRTPECPRSISSTCSMCCYPFLMRSLRSFVFYVLALELQNYTVPYEAHCDTILLSCWSSVCLPYQCQFCCQHRRIVR